MARIRSSDELCRIFGRPTLEDIHGFIEVVHPDDRDMVEAAVRAWLEDHKRPTSPTACCEVRRMCVGCRSGRTGWSTTVGTR